MAGDRIRKPRAQTTPPFSPLLPRRNFGYLEAGHCHQEWCGKVGPARIAIEVCTMEQVPRRVHRVTSESGPWIRAFVYDDACGRFDCNSVRRKNHAPVRLTERFNGCTFHMSCDGSLKRPWIHFKALHRQQPAARDDGCAHLIEFPTIKS